MEYHNHGSRIMNKRCFSLVDLIFLIAILLVLAVIGIHLFPFFRYSHSMGPRAMCASNIRQLGLGLNTYTQENSDKLPAVPCDLSVGNKTKLIGTDINQGKSINNGQSPWRKLQPNTGDNPYAKDDHGKYIAPIHMPTVSASLWLLCRNNMALPKTFVCPSVIKKDRSRGSADERKRKPHFPQIFFRFLY